jgi:type II restriction enzyme
MLLCCDTTIADRYTSQAQKSRVLSEAWFQSNAYCLSCESDTLRATAANTKATDFICPACDQNYELKAFRHRPVRTLVDGAYSALMARIRSGSVPTLMMLERSDSWEIQSLIAIHHLFLTPNVVEMRKPLSQTARRAGWVGCNIRLDRIAADAKIEVVSQCRQQSARLVRESFQRFERLKKIPIGMRGWTTLTLQVIRGLQREAFTLNDLYEMEIRFAEAYPQNKNIRPKIRQQLQVLRDLGFVSFLGSGDYRLLI